MAALLGTAHAQSASPQQAAFRLCDARAFVALNMARTYLHDGKNRQQVLDAVKGNEWGSALAQELFRREESGQLRHHAEFAADVLVQCAINERVDVGATKPAVQLCFARSDIAHHLHNDRSAGLVRQEAVARTSAWLEPRSVYPTALVNAVAESIYAPVEPPSLRQAVGQMFWSCVRSARPAAASAASR